MEAYLGDDDYDKYTKAKSLSEVTNDPEKNPYKSKYEARNLLQQLKETVHKLREDNDDDVLRSMEGSIEHQLGVNSVYTEEVPAGEEHLKRVLHLFDDASTLKPSVVSILIATNNELGILWSSRTEGNEKAYEHLQKSVELYANYIDKCDDSPFTIDEFFLTEKPSQVERRKAFEVLHTHTLYYIAQVSKNLGKTDDSAMFCMKTLQRQLNLEIHKPLEWALNCACLSQYYITHNKFEEAKHCLSCASFVEQQEEDNAKSDETKADIARCWVKYCLAILEESKSDESSSFTHDMQANVDGDNKSFERFSIEATSLEESVPHTLVKCNADARSLFQTGKKYAEVALGFFVLDGFVTDFVELNQDISHLYQHMADFYPEEEIKCRLHKRRIDLLVPVLKELNPQYYLAICRQLQFEIGEVYNEMLSFKLSLASSNSDRLSLHATKKLLALCNSGVLYFKMFLKTCEEPRGSFPSRFESDVERPALLAHFYIARFFSKKPAARKEDKVKNLKESLEKYSFIVDYVEMNSEAEKAVEAELEICREMVALLPFSIEQVGNR